MCTKCWVPIYRLIAFIAVEHSLASTIVFVIALSSAEVVEFVFFFGEADNDCLYNDDDSSDEECFSSLSSDSGMVCTNNMKCYIVNK